MKRDNWDARGEWDRRDSEGNGPHGIQIGARLLVLVLIQAAACTGAPCYAADAPASPAPTFDWSSWTGAGTIRTEAGDVKPMLWARFSAVVNLPSGFHAVGRVDASRQQDGGAVTITDPNTFDTAEAYAGAYKDVGSGIGVAAIYGIAVPFLGGRAQVLERYPQTLFGGARYADAGGLLVYAGLGTHDAAGPGLKGMVTAQIPTGGKSAIVVEAVEPHGFIRTLVLLRLK